MFVINFGCVGGWFCFSLGALFCVECWAVLAPIICFSVFLALPSTDGFRNFIFVLSVWLCWVVIITKWCWVLLLLVQWDPCSGEVGTFFVFCGLMLFWLYIRISLRYYLALWSSILSVVGWVGRFYLGILVVRKSWFPLVYYLGVWFWLAVGNLVVLCLPERLFLVSCKPFTCARRRTAIIILVSCWCRWVLDAFNVYYYIIFCCVVVGFLLLVHVLCASRRDIWIFAGKKLVLDRFLLLPSLWVLVLKHHRMYLGFYVFYCSKDLVLVDFFTFNFVALLSSREREVLLRTL